VCSYVCLYVYAHVCSYVCSDMCSHVCSYGVFLYVFPCMFLWCFLICGVGLSQGCFIISAPQILYYKGFRQSPHPGQIYILLYKTQSWSFFSFLRTGDSDLYLLTLNRCDFGGIYIYIYIYIYITHSTQHCKSESHHVEPPRRKKQTDVCKSESCGTLTMQEEKSADFFLSTGTEKKKFIRAPVCKKKVQKKSSIVSFFCKCTGTLTFEIFFFFSCAASRCWRLCRR
jgi:hypothetical protein